MDINKNYYKILEINKSASDKEIKKSYHKLSFKYHPDQNKNIDSSLFKNITEAYRILIDSEKRKEYDIKSKWGKNYGEYLDFDFNLNQNKEDSIKNENNIEIQINIDKFNGNLEYERWVKCKTCDGSGRDFFSKIVIKNKKSETIKVFDGKYGCDFCDGTGEYNGSKCNFCDGKGKVGLKPCRKCKGAKIILGKQKIKNVKLTGNITKIDSMGNFSKDGKVGSLIIISN